jgi:hypothetical protein
MAVQCRPAALRESLVLAEDAESSRSPMRQAPAALYLGRMADIKNQLWLELVATRGRSMWGAPRRRRRYFALLLG